jgi:hypothetical protein
MNTGVTASSLIDCIAAIPCGAGSRFNAGITKVEKAKNTPATRPQPSAVTRVQDERRAAHRARSAALRFRACRRGTVRTVLPPSASTNASASARSIAST